MQPSHARSFRKCDATKKSRLGIKKVYFYWLCPGFDAWSWFATLLMDMEEKLAEQGELDFLDIRIHMTRGWTADDAAKIILQDNEDGAHLLMLQRLTWPGDTVIRDGSGRSLRHKMNFGRPNWDREFEAMSRAHPGYVDCSALHGSLASVTCDGLMACCPSPSPRCGRTDVGVFFCGPKVLSTELHKVCNKHTDATSTQGTRFSYNKENF